MHADITALRCQSVNVWHVDNHRHLLQDGVHTHQTSRKMAEFEKGSISTAVCFIQFSMASIEMVSRLEDVSDDACRDICGVQSINARYVDIHRHLLQDGVHTDQTGRKMATHRPCGQCFEVSFCKGHIDSAAMVLDRDMAARFLDRNWFSHAGVVSLHADTSTLQTVFLMI
ncbi:hypothetical protein LEN26_012565 [Aphanomyces euteiches]|nr:hypothetical protein LEN26_012565 [Aphanomyces euteiches]